MKKTYIKPENIVVHLNVERMMCQSAQYSNSSASTTGAGVDDVTPEAGTQGLAREVLISDETTIIARNAWEKW